MAWKVITQAPAGSVLKTVYWAEYVPPPTFTNVIVAPVGEFAVTVAPVAGEPDTATDTERVTVSPRPKTEFGAGLTIDTEKA